MRPVLVLLMIVLASPAWAQGRQSRDSSGADARTDAILGTPNKVTPVPQDNRFSTSPGLEQQAPGPQGKMPSPASPTTDKPR
jgi:hypothetical protein